MEDGGGSLRVIGGSEGRVAVIRWYSSEDELVGEVYAGSTVGMVLENKDRDGSWTSHCIDEGVSGLCD